jgi:hypothetical protein
VSSCFLTQNVVENLGALIFYARALDDPNIEPIEITDPDASITDVRIPEVPLARVQEVLTPGFA